MPEHLQPKRQEHPDEPIGLFDLGTMTPEQVKSLYAALVLRDDEERLEGVDSTELGDLFRAIESGLLTLSDRNLDHAKTVFTALAASESGDDRSLVACCLTGLMAHDRGLAAELWVRLLTDPDEEVGEAARMSLRLAVIERCLTYPQLAALADEMAEVLSSAKTEEYAARHRA